MLIDLAKQLQADDPARHASYPDWIFPAFKRYHRLNRVLVRLQKARAALLGGIFGGAAQTLFVFFHAPQGGLYWFYGSLLLVLAGVILYPFAAIAAKRVTRRQLDLRRRFIASGLRLDECGDLYVDQSHGALLLKAPLKHRSRSALGREIDFLPANSTALGL